MITSQRQTEIRQEAGKLADQLFEQVKLSQNSAVSGLLVPAKRIEEQDFFQQQVVAALGQQVTRTVSENELVIRNASK